MRAKAGSVVRIMGGPRRYLVVRERLADCDLRALDNGLAGSRPRNVPKEALDVVADGYLAGEDDNAAPLRAAGGIG